MSAYSKSFAAIVATVLSAIVASLVGDGVVSPVEWVNVAIGAAGAAAVFTAPNVPGAIYTKSILAVITAVLTLGADLLLLPGGLGTSEYLQLALVALGALGVYAVPNGPAKPAHC